MNKPILTKHSLVPRIPYLLSSESSNYILKSSNYSLLTKEDFSELISPNKIFNLSFRTATLANLTVYHLATKILKRIQTHVYSQLEASQSCFC